MKIGLPKALLYHKYGYLWREFFNELGQDIVISPDSNREILNRGIKASTDECCLSFKIYLGHIEYLLDKCDYVLVPRIENFSKGEKVCVKFNALYDIVKNTFKVNALDYDIDSEKGRREVDGFINIGKSLGFKRSESLRAYKRAKEMQQYNERIDNEREVKNLDKRGLKILVIGHSYNCHDLLIGKPIINHILSLGAEVIYADRFCEKDCIKASKNVCSELSWTFNKHLVGAMELYKDKIDGIVFITTFPCGPDSLINELVIRKTKNIPICNIIVDELQAENGLITRIESFLDIINERKRGVYYGKNN